METPKIENLPPPPNVIGALKAGFETISTHLTVILFPLILDLLLWLGPRLSVDKLFLPVLAEFQRLTKDTSLPSTSPADVASAIEIYKQAFERFNLLSVLRTFPIGISSLISGMAPTGTPLGTAQILPVLSSESLLGWIALLTLLGWLGGGIYFRWVASLALPPEQSVSGRAVWQSLALSIIFMILSFMIGMPLFLVIYVLFLVSPVLAQGVLLLMGFLSMWLVVPLFFAGHGIFMRGQNVFASILSGIQMARFSLPTSSLFVLCVLFISMGLNFLWSIPSPDSWMLLVGILGHAFITTALLAASFIYYRDMTGWLQTVMEKLKANPLTPQA